MANLGLKTLSLSILAILSCDVVAETDTAQDTTHPAVLAALTVTSNNDSAADNYVATQASSVLKSNAPLFNTPQSVTVVTREQLDQKQATTLAEAINGVAGVSAGHLGRRGWDDFIIRGQNSSNQVFIDGLRQAKETSVAVDLSGVEQVQVLKGPASINFGLVEPGGLVNLVSKRPQASSFAKADISYGSYGFLQGTFDLNYAPQHSEKGAFRLTGRIADQDDPTDYVYFKNFFVSREYMRQQGIPVIGSLKTNPNGAVSRSLYLGEPSFGGYEADVYRVGYTLSHAWDNGWRFRQNFAAQKTEMTGRVAFTQTGTKYWATAYTTLNRSNNARYQQHDVMTYSIDNSLQKNFAWLGWQHEFSIGVDGMQSKDDYINDTYTTGNLNIYSPVYGQAVTYKSHAQTLNRLRYLGLYLKDRIQINDRLLLSLGAREDWSQASSQNIAKSLAADKNEANAFTWNAGLLYNLSDRVAPYISYATSFIPNTKADAEGNILAPETAKQAEIGLKLQGLDRRLQASLAVYDLRRTNVAIKDANDEYTLRGEQTTQGIEAELQAKLSKQWRMSASLSHMLTAEVSKDTSAENVGSVLENVPDYTYSLSLRYRPSGDELGWYIGAGIRGESSKPVDNLDVRVPGYTLYDTEVGYDAAHWGAQLSIRNVFDKDYFAGALNENMVTLGDPRQINFKLKFNY
jgi:iron complex outermembrane receptor protein